MKRIVLLLIAFILFGCNEGKKPQTSRASENLKEGYVWVDAANIVHWDEKCKRVYKDMLLLKPLEKKPTNYCSCVSPKDKESIENEFHKTKDIKIAKSDSIVGGALPKYLLNIEGKEYPVSVENIEKYTMQKYAADYPGATIRMRNDKDEDYDIPLSRYEWAVNSGLHPFISY